MPFPADLLIFLVVLAALWIAYRLIGYQRDRSRGSLGDRDAYDGNLLPPGESHRPSAGPRSHGGGHPGHGGGHITHGGGHGGGHAGGVAAGGGHH